MMIRVRKPTLSTIGRSLSDEEQIETIAHGKRNGLTRRISQMSLLHARERKLSRSDGALNCRDVLKVTQDEGKSKEDSFRCNNSNNNNNKQMDKVKQKRKEGITKVPEMMTRFLSNNKRKRRKESIISRILSSEKEEITEDTSYLLRYAVRQFNTARVIELVSNEETNIDGANQRGITALHEAGIDGNIVCMKILVSHGAGINGTDCEGFTPLDYAVFAGNFECAAYLIEKGAKEDRIRDGQIVYKEFQTNNRRATFS